MSYIVKMSHNEFVSLPAYDKNTAEAGKTYRLFKKGYYNLKTMTGYITKINFRYGDELKNTVHKVHIQTATTTEEN